MRAFAIAWSAATVVSFFALCTYGIVTPGSTGTLFSSWDGPVDPTQQMFAQVWMLYGIIGTAVMWALATIPKGK